MIAQLLNLVVAIGVYPLWWASFSGWAWWVTAHAAARPWELFS